MTVIPGCNVGCNADYRRNDYYYVRVSRPGAWETRARAPLEPLWKSWVAGILFVFFLTGVMALVSMFGG